MRGEVFAWRDVERLAFGINDEDDGHAVLQLWAIPCAQKGNVFAAGRDVQGNEVLMQRIAELGMGSDEPEETLAGGAVRLAELDPEVFAGFFGAGEGLSEGIACIHLRLVGQAGLGAEQSRQQEDEQDLAHEEGCARRTADASGGGGWGLREGDNQKQGLRLVRGFGSI